MTILFNHAILEVSWAGETRWFDLTERGQGGGFHGRAVGWFGHGLPVDKRDSGLRVQPGVPHGGVYALSEKILLDTTKGGVSLVEQRVRAEGVQADNLRRARLAQGAELFAKEREQQMQRRYSKAQRLGELEWRDDREGNVCELAEAFEIGVAVYADESGKRALFDVPPNLVLQGFSLPEDKARREPWSMPYPLEVRHKLTVTSPSMASGAGRRRRWEEREFEAHLEEPRLKGAWTKTCRLKIKLPEVAAERVPVFRKQLEEVMRESGWRLYLPWGQGRTRRGENFGKLPPVEEGEAAYVPALSSEAGFGPINANDVKLGRNEGRMRRRPRWRRTNPWTGEMPRWVFGIGWFLFAMLMLGLSRSCAVNGTY